MNEQQIVTWLLEEKLAGNEFQAQNMGRKLRLHELDTDEAQKDRCRRYREFRRAGENRDAAAIKAISGEKAPERLIGIDYLKQKEIHLKDHHASKNGMFETCLNPDCRIANQNILSYKLDPAGVEAAKQINDEPAPLTQMTGEELADYFSDKTEEE